MTALRFKNIPRADDDDATSSDTMAGGDSFALLIPLIALLLFFKSPRAPPADPEGAAVAGEVAALEGEKALAKLDSGSSTPKKETHA